MNKILVSGLLAAFLGAAAQPSLSGAQSDPATGPSGAASRPRYDIRVELDDAAKMLRGVEELVWVNPTRDEVPDLRFHLYWNAFKNESSAFLREAAEETFMGRGAAPKDGEWGWIEITSLALADGTDLKPVMAYVADDEPLRPDDQTVLRVPLPSPVPPGGEVRLRIGFEAKIPRTVARAGYYRNSYFIAQWFPKPGVYEEGKGWNCHAYHQRSEFFADFADFTVRMTVPEAFVVGSSGVQTAAEKDAARKVVTYTYAQERIHDFAWTADPRYLKIERDFVADSEVTPEEYEAFARLLGLPFEEIKLPNVKMTLLIEPEHRGQIERHFRALRNALKYYGLWYGPYPYAAVTMIDPPFRTGSGGMEYPTLFTAGTGVVPSPAANSPEMVIIHEFGHGYWYGLVANNEFEDAWLDEGINTYSTGRVLATAYGPGTLPLNFKGIPLDRLIRKLPRVDDWETDRAAAIHVAEMDPVTTWSWKFYNSGSYAANVYMRAGTLLNTLERLLGEETMARVMRTYHMRWRFRHPKTEDFIAVASEVSGRDLGWFFDELFRETRAFDYGLADFRSVDKPKRPRGVFDVAGRKEELTRAKRAELEKKEKPAKGEAPPRTYITTATLRRFGEARLGGGALVELKVTFEDGSVQERFWDGRDRWARFTFETPAKAVRAEIDPDRIWLIDSDFANNSRLLKPARKAVLRLGAGLVFLLQNLLLGVGSLG